MKCNINAISLQSTPLKTDTFGTSTNCSSYRGAHLKLSQLKGVKKFTL